MLHMTVEQLEESWEMRAEQAEQTRWADNSPRCRATTRSAWRLGSGLLLLLLVVVVRDEMGWELECL